MEGILPKLRRCDKKRLLRNLRKFDDMKRRTRYLIIVNLMHGRSTQETAVIPQVGRSTVYDVGKRFRASGEAGLVVRREENGQRTLDERYLATLHVVVESSAHDHGWRRPTWTREMLVKTLRDEQLVSGNHAR